MDTNLSELREVYENIREEILTEADKRGYAPEYRYENESGSETPVGFFSNSSLVQFENSRLFEILVRGNLDQLKEVWSGGELYELLKEIFGPNEENDSQSDIENQEYLERAA